ncbi:MAG: dTDP-4-dehydrorhamnose reductase [Planctomycetia bacterium]|nr:dTDP-4-dehydrorhamnose reductase [Planctomycetia bacterium]
MTTTIETPKILLIGSQGQLGWELRRSLRPLGKVICAARRGDANTLAVDLADPDSLRALIRDTAPRLIVNAAVYSQVDQAEKEPELARAVNAIAPGVIQAEANRLGAAVVHYSTDYVFDGTGTRPWEETDPTNPPNTYGRSKREGESAVEAEGGAYAVLRTSWVYGIHGVNFVKKILKLASERPTLRIVDDQIGAPTSARMLADVSAQMLACAQGNFAALLRERGEIFHVCCGGETSWCGFTKTIVERARLLGMTLKVEAIEPITSKEFPTPAARPLNSRLSCARLQREYRLTPPTWQEALDDTLPLLLKWEFGV